MWCDDLDVDLIRVVPGAVEALGDAADVQLRTFSNLTDGTINHPACWSTDFGFTSFFWTDELYRPPASYRTDAPEVGCTFLEAIRDEWVHSCLIAVNRRIVWRPRPGWLDRLMYDVRGITVLEDNIREQIREAVRDSLRTAAAKLLASS